MRRPDHLFLSMDGSLYDTRDPDWSRKPPLRADFCAWHRTITTTQQLKATLREGGRTGTTSLGCYPCYLIMADGEALSFAAARDNLREVLAATHHDNPDRTDQWRVVACEINYEDPRLFCAHSNERIPSAYAEDDAAVDTARAALGIANPEDNGDDNE
jgi:hypothetical protein